MNDLRDVAEQPADGVRREPRWDSRVGRPCWSGRPRGRVDVGVDRQLSEFDLGDGRFEFVELVVQRADLLAIVDLEQAEIRPRAGELRATIFDARVELGGTGVKRVERGQVVVGSSTHGFGGSVHAATVAHGGVRSRT